MASPNPIEAFLRKEIDEKGARTRADRSAIYSDFIKRIDDRVGQHPDPLEQAQHRSFYQKLLDEAKSTIESEYLVENEEKTERTFADHIVEFGKRHWKWVSGAGAIASFVSEFAKPLAEFTGLLAGGSAIGLVAALVMARKAKSETTNRACVSAAVVCGVFGLSSMTMLSVRAIFPDAQANGAVAKIVPGMEGFQQQVLGLNKKLGQIATSSAETARNTEQIVATSAQTAQNTQQVASVVETLKRETSEDPAKELANLGVTPLAYQDAFLQGLLRQDERLVALIEKTGFKPDISTYQALLSQPYANIFRQGGIKERLMSDREKFADAFCRPENADIKAYDYKNSEDAINRIIFVYNNIGFEFISKICGDFNNLISKASILQEKQWIADCKTQLEVIRAANHRFTCEFKNRDASFYYSKVSAVIPVQLVSAMEELKKLKK
jgi:hypothetical protein